jgi:hypothetical protein
MHEQLGRFLIIAGLVLALIGVAVYFSKFLPIGRLPGDISIQKGNFSFFFPITTCIIISVVLTIIFLFIGKR